MWDQDQLDEVKDSLNANFLIGLTFLLNLAVYVKEPGSFAPSEFLLYVTLPVKTMTILLYHQWYFGQCLIYFFSIGHYPLLCSAFDAASAKFENILSTTLSADVFVF